MSTDVLIAVLGTGGFSAIVGAGMTGLFTKRKLGAEATEIITKAATGVVTAMEHQLDRAHEDLVNAEARHESRMAQMAQAHVKERAAWMKVLQLHVAWDVMAIARLAEATQTNADLLPLPDPPPVTPAQRFVDDTGFPIGDVD